MKKTIKKDILKSGYYWEYTDLYDTLPDKLPVRGFNTVILEKNMKYQAILDTFNIVPEKSFSAAAAIASSAINTIENNQYRVIFFTEDGTRYRLYVCRLSGGRLEVGVGRVIPGGQWGAGRGVLFSNGNSDALPSLTLEPLDTLTLAIKTCKDNGFEVFKRM